MHIYHIYINYLLQIQKYQFHYLINLQNSKLHILIDKNYFLKYPLNYYYLQVHLL